MTTSSHSDLTPASWRNTVFNRAVLAATLGNFVNMYDLLLFSVVRIQSLRSLGVPDDELLDVGVRLLNLQMFGTLIGGVIWGVVADRIGRMTVLFASVAMYSLANIANAYVTDVGWYGALRLLAGIGLAGELGASITMVSEALPRYTRGLGTTFVAGIGVTGAILAAVVSLHSDWQTCYLVGGILGLVALGARLPLGETAMFEHMMQLKQIRRGQWASLFTDSQRLKRFARCVLLGMPIWFVIGILATFSPEICQALGATGPVIAGDSILYFYIAMSTGCLLAGLLSQRWRSRRRAVIIMICTMLAVFGGFLSLKQASPELYYAVFVGLGLCCGYWALFVTIPAEEFGTNLRATVATSVPNILRGSVVILTLAVEALTRPVGMIGAVVAVGLGCFVLSFFGFWRLSESFGRDLDFFEQ